MDISTNKTTHTSLHQDTITTHYNCHRCGYIHQQNNCPKTGQRCQKCKAIGHFSALCTTQYTNSHSQNRHHYRRPRHWSRSPSRDSNTSPWRSRHSNSPTRLSTHRQCRYRWSPQSHLINSITIAEPSAASYSDTEDIPVQLKKCKNRCRTPLPAKLFTFPSYSDTEDPDTTCDELPVSDTSSETELNPGYKILPEDINTDTDFIPFQDHTRCITGPSTCSQSESRTEEPYTSNHFTVGSIELHEDSNTTIEDEQSHLDNTTYRHQFLTIQNHIVHIPRPHHSPRPTRQHLQPHINQSKQIMNTTYIQKTKPLHIPVPKDTKSIRTVISTLQQIFKCQAVLPHQMPKLPWNSQHYPHKRHLQPLHTLNKQGNIIITHTDSASSTT